MMKKYTLFTLLLIASFSLFAYDWPQENVEQTSIKSYFGQKRGEAISTSLVFSDPESWFGTDDYDCYKNHRGGKKIPPEKLQEALKEYAFFYHHSFHIVKAK